MKKIEKKSKGFLLTQWNKAENLISNPKKIFKPILKMKIALKRFSNLF